MTTRRKPAVRPAPSRAHAAVRRTVPLEPFFQKLDSSLPFGSNKVSRSVEAASHVDTIHEAELNKILVLAARARDENCAIGAVLWGEPGIGKSHLLMRLAQRAASIKEPACFIYIYSIHPSPSEVPRYVLKELVAYLTGSRTSDFHETKLFALMKGAVARAQRQGQGKTKKKAPPSIDDDQAVFASLRAAFHRLIDRLGDEDPTRAALLDRDVFDVLFRFFQSAYTAIQREDDGVAGIAARWLQGREIDPEEALQIGLRPERDEPVALPDPQRIKAVIVALTQLARLQQQPVLLCFDQVDIIPEEVLHELSLFVHGLIDSAGNLLVVTSGVQRVLLHRKESGVIMQASWERLAQFPIHLKSISPDEGKKVLIARLGPFLQDFIEHPTLNEALRRDPLFPLGVPWFTAALGDRGSLRPRDILLWAHDRWERIQEQVRESDGQRWLKTWQQVPDAPVPREESRPLEMLIDEHLEAELADLREDRIQNQHGLPPDGDNLINLLHGLLDHCVGHPGHRLSGVEHPAVKAGRIPTYNLIVQRDRSGQKVTIGICAVVTDSKRSATIALRKLIDEQDTDMLLLVTDQRIGLQRGPQGQEAYDELLRLSPPRFRHLDLDFEDYAMLDALRGVISSSASSGDLEIDLPDRRSHRIAETEVIASHHRRDRYLAHPLLRAVLSAGEPATAAPQSPNLPPPVQTPDPGHKQQGAALHTMDMRAFIKAQLALRQGMVSGEVAQRFHADHPDLRLALEAVRSHVEATARAMHEEKLIQATPHGDGLYLLNRP